MCLIAFRLAPEAFAPLVFVSNRDEFYARPTAPASFWSDAPEVLAGRDLKGGGTWMGVTKTGRWAALTNVREPHRHDPDAPSRGDLVAEYLRGTQRPMDYLATVAADARRYNGFNLLVGHGATVAYLANRARANAEPYGVGTDADEVEHAPPRRVAPGLHGLSNALLNTPWPKTERVRQKLARVLATTDVEATPDPLRLLDLLDDDVRPSDDALPDTGVGLDLERVLSSLFIRSPDYGTRASTALVIFADGRVVFAERTFVRGIPKRTRVFRFRSVPAPADVR
jgi:uncharacterized protein with NRDE domain